jgi:hypothetical protein
MRRRPNSTRRASTCAGPTRAATAIAAVVLVARTQSHHRQPLGLPPIEFVDAAAGFEAEALLGPLEHGFGGGHSAVQRQERAPIPAPRA